MRLKDIHPDFIAIAIMIFALIIHLYTNIPYLEFYNDFATVEFVVETAAYCAGIMILIMSDHEGLHKCLFVCSMVYSVIYFKHAWNILFESFRYFEDQLPPFIEGIMMMIVSILILFNIVMYIRRLSTSTSMIFYALVASLAMEVVLLLSSYRSLRDVELWFNVNMFSLPIYILCIFLLIIVNKKGVKSKTVLYSIRSSFRKIEASTFYQGLTVQRSVVDKIKDLDGSNLWCDRYEFLMNSYEDGDYKAVMISDNGRTHVTISGKDDTTGMNGYRFDLRGVVLDTGDLYTCDTIRLYDEDGYFVQLIVSEEFVDRTKKPTVKQRLMSDSIVDLHS